MTTQSNVSSRTHSLYASLALGVLAALPAAARTNWTIDPARTQIAFAIDAVGYPRTQGHFRRFEGRISVDFERPEKSSVAFHVQSGSVDVGSASFSDYLRSSAFLARPQAGRPYGPPRDHLPAPWQTHAVPGLLTSER